ncbi:glycosyltransferase family 2 protein [Roseibium sp.]|uniref:glycosyltransferase family 2 protein n=1 Tax=Roseibium sp. TaxID=1936156 RepID=UPI003D100E12
MKLIVQIPCFNEETTLPLVIAGIPRSFPGVDAVEILVIDDGSSDRTAAIAREHGADHVISNNRNKGLASSFQAGIEAALARGADIIVNTDGDNQYSGSSIPDLVRPILEQRADIVVGDRNPGDNSDFSWLKRQLQKIGTRIVGNLARVDVNDAVSGFRAYSRNAAYTINVMTRFSYTTESLIHAGQRDLTVVSVPVMTNPTTRPSRLTGSTSGFLRKQIVTILRSYFMYRPLSAFLSAGLVMIAIGLLPVLRFLFYYATGDGDGHIQSLVLGSMFLLAGYITVVIAFLSDSLSTNRRLTESVLERVRQLEMKSSARDRETDQ